MAKAPIPQHVTELIKTYQKAQIELINIIAKPEKDLTVVAYRKRVLASVNEELRVLNEYATGWAEENIPIAYKKGAADTYEKFRELNIEVGKVQINTRVLKNLVNNATGMLIDANNYVGRMINDEIRKVSLEVIAEKVATGSTVKEAQAKLVQRLTDKGVANIVDKRGRAIRLESYAETVARTTTAEATNKGAINAVTDLGEDLVRMTWHNASCPICAVLEGRIYSISGKSKGYPPLSEALPDGRSTPHPNCRHRFVFYSVKYDDNSEQNKKMSNRPFEIGKQEQARVDAYYKAQKEKAALNRVKKEWQTARLVAPAEAPKTLSGYVKLKANKPEEFTALRSKVLDARKA
jgi:hypothetical protein